MADPQSRISAAAAAASRRNQQQPPSRLQRRAPASLQINRSDWKAAIPLLTPLVSPSSPVEIQNRPVDSGSSASSSSRKESEPEKPPVLSNWHHPAAPFNYDSVGSRALRFVPV